MQFWSVSDGKGRHFAKLGKEHLDHRKTYHGWCVWHSQGLEVPPICLLHFPQPYFNQPKVPGIIKHHLLIISSYHMYWMATWLEGNHDGLTELASLALVEYFLSCHRKVINWNLRDSKFTALLLQIQIFRGVTACHWLCSSYCAFICRVILDLKGAVILQNIENHSPSDTASHSRRLDIFFN